MFGDSTVKEAIKVRWGHKVGPLIWSDWRPYGKRDSGDLLLGMHREKGIWGHAEQVAICEPEGDLTWDQLCWHLDLERVLLRHVREQMSAAKATQSVVFFVATRTDRGHVADTRGTISSIKFQNLCVRQALLSPFQACRNRLWKRKPCLLMPQVCGQWTGKGHSNRGAHFLTES